MITKSAYTELVWNILVLNAESCDHGLQSVQSILLFAFNEADLNLTKLDMRLR